MIGLYYPYIHFRDENWLKLALLYWSKVARIVPESYRTIDSPDVRRVAEELGAVIDIRPNLAASDIAGDLERFIERHASLLRKKYAVTRSSTWKVNRDTQTRAPKGTDPRFSYIFSRKFDYELAQRLIHEQLAFMGEGPNALWIGVHPNIARVYMTMIAESIAKSTGYGLLADDVTQHLVVGERSLDRLAELLLQQPFEANNLISREAVALTAIRTVLPRNLSEVSMRKIIKFRKQYASEFADFENWINGEVKRLTDETGQISDASAMTHHMEGLESRIKPKMKELRKQLRYLGVESATTSMAIKLPVIVAGAAAAKYLDAPVVGVAGAAFATIPIFTKSAREAHKLVSGNPMAFLMHAQERLAPRTLIQRIDARFRRITTGV